MYNITDYGAVGDGKTLCTENIQKAIDDCTKNGGGRVTVPSGVYYTGTIWLKSNVELHLENGATLKAGNNLDDYNNDELDDTQDTNFYQNTACVPEEWRGKHLIIACECENVAITGYGTVDASADEFFEDVWFDDYKNVYWYPDGWCWAKDKEKLRPGQVIMFAECKHVNIDGITVCNAPCWDIFIYGCDHVQVHGVRVENPRYFINTDGIDIDCCSYVTVSDCVIDTGDDAITVRSNPSKLKNKNKKCQYVSISNCTLSSACAAFRIGVGSGDLEHVSISNISVSRAACGILMTGNWNREFSTGMKNIRFSNFACDYLSSPIAIVSGRHKKIEDVVIDGFSAKACAHMQIISENGGEVSEGFTFRNCDITFADNGVELTDDLRKERGEDMILVDNVKNVTFENFTVRYTEEDRKKWRRVIDINNCSSVRMNGFEMKDI